MNTTIDRQSELVSGMNPTKTKLIPTRPSSTLRKFKRSKSTWNQQTFLHLCPLYFPIFPFFLPIFSFLPSFLPFFFTNCCVCRGSNKHNSRRQRGRWKAATRRGRRRNALSNLCKPSTLAEIQLATTTTTTTTKQNKRQPKKKPQQTKQNKTKAHKTNGKKTQSTTQHNIPAMQCDAHTKPNQTKL